MHLTPEEKQAIKDTIVASLVGEPEVRRIVVFGSFVMREDPGDIDIAIFQDSRLGYLELAQKYRRALRAARLGSIPLDVIPLRMDGDQTLFGREIGMGETIYER